jgi:hypothetical protein
MEIVISILIALLLARFVANEASLQRAKRKGDVLRFPPGMGLRLKLGAGGPFLLYVTYQVTLLARESGEWWLPVMTGLIALGAVVFMPPEIQINQWGVEERGLLGFRKKRVPWEGAAASHVPGLGEVLVLGRTGPPSRIRNTMLDKTSF